MLVRTEAKVLDSLSGVLWASEEEGVGSGWGTESQLIKGQGLTTGSQNASTGSGCETKSSHGELRDGQQTVVVGDCADDNDGLVVGLLGGVANNAGDGDRGSVDAGHKKSAENDLVEGGLSSACGRQMRFAGEG